MASGLIPLSRAGWGRWPQRLGNQPRLRAIWNIPRQFTLENRRIPLALPQSFGKLRKDFHVFALDTLLFLDPRRNTKSVPACAETVDAVTSLWSHEEILDSTSTISIVYSMLSITCMLLKLSLQQPQEMPRS